MENEGSGLAVGYSSPSNTPHNIRQHLGNAPMVRKDKGLQGVHNPLKELFGNRIKNRKKK